MRVLRLPILVAAVALCAAAPPTLPGYQINLGNLEGGGLLFAPGTVPMWIDTSNTSVAPYGLPRPASVEYPLPVVVVSGAVGSSGGNAAGVVAASTTQTSGVLDPTPGKFTLVLAAATSLRKGCLYQDKSGAPSLAYFGTAQAPTAINSLPVPAGGSVSCTAGSVVLQDALFVASQTAASAPYVLALQ